MPPKYKQVGTMDTAPDTPKLHKSASTWTRQDLDYLGVDFDYEKFYKIEIPVDNMPPELLAGNLVFASFNL
jgi:hypothetical protein